MSLNPLRQEVLKSFKSLHRTCQTYLKSNKEILKAAKKEINDSYKKNKNVTEQNTIEELIRCANNVQYEIRTTVCEFEKTAPNVYRLKLRPEMFHEAENPPKS